MSAFLIGCAAAGTLGLVPCALLLRRGGVVDLIAALQLGSAVTVVALLALGAALGRAFLFDVALMLALLGPPAGLLWAKFAERWV